MRIDGELKGHRGVWGCVLLAGGGRMRCWSWFVSLLCSGLVRGHVCGEGDCLASGSAHALVWFWVRDSSERYLFLVRDCVVTGDGRCYLPVPLSHCNIPTIGERLHVARCWNFALYRALDKSLVAGPHHTASPRFSAMCSDEGACLPGLGLPCGPA